MQSEISDFHAIPEIAAAVQSFVTSREASPGIYVYFDVGGGTVDGVAFNYINRNGERQLNFYSGKVTPLGLSALGHRASAGGSEAAAIALFDEFISGHPDVLHYADQLRKLVGHVVITARRKDGRNWRQDVIQEHFLDRKFLGNRDSSKLRHLIIFVGGGGARSEWYQNTVLSTYRLFQHDRNGIPPYQLTEVPKPKDLFMAGLEDGEFRRFAVSYGLSIPSGEGPVVRLPSQFTEPPPLPPRPDAFDYANSKDLT